MGRWFPLRLRVVTSKTAIGWRKGNWTCHKDTVLTVSFKINILQVASSFGQFLGFWKKLILTKVFLWSFLLLLLCKREFSKVLTLSFPLKSFNLFLKLILFYINFMTYWNVYLYLDGPGLFLGKNLFFTVKTHFIERACLASALNLPMGKILSRAEILAKLLIWFSCTRERMAEWHSLSSLFLAIGTALGHFHYCNNVPEASWLYKEKSFV